MKSSKKSSENDKSFFTSLRRLGRGIDHGLEDVRNQLDYHTVSLSDSNRHLALKGLLDRKKELDSLTKSSRTLLNEMRHRGNDFELLLQKCCQVIDGQMQQLTSIQNHLMEYGFVPQPEAEDTTCVEISQEEEAEETEAESSTIALKNEAKETLEKRNELSPCLEDFGVSSYTLNMLNRKPQVFKAPEAELPANGHARVMSVRSDGVPTPFQNKGLIVTPSLFPSHAHDGTGQEVFGLACSPDTVNRGQVLALDQDCGMQSEDAAVARTLDFSESPVPPVLHTPGIKQIPSLKDVAQPTQGERKGNVARQLKLGDGVATIDSPVPPILRTPGIKQISTSEHHRAKETQTKESNEDELQLPQTPEFTYSLKNLEDMTMSFRQVDLSSTFSERSGTSGSDFDMSGSMKTGNFTQMAQHDVRMGTVPSKAVPGSQLAQQDVRMGTLLSRAAPGSQLAQDVRMGTLPSKAAPGSQLAQQDVRMSTLSSRAANSQPTEVTMPQLSSWSREKFQHDSLDLPPTPELTLSYTNRPLFKAVSQASHNHHSEVAGDGFNARHCVNKEDDVENPSHLPLGRPGFLPSYSTNMKAHVADAKSSILCSTENIHTSRPAEGLGKVSGGGSAMPHQPKLQHDLLGSGLDIPPSPKLFGSYHFLGSKR